MAAAGRNRSIRLPDPAWDWLDAEAERDQLSVNGVVLKIVAAAMKEGRAPGALALPAPKPRPGARRVVGYSPIDRTPIYADEAGPRPKGAKGAKK